MCYRGLKATKTAPFEYPEGRPGVQLPAAERGRRGTLPEGFRCCKRFVANAKGSAGDLIRMVLEPGPANSIRAEITPTSRMICSRAAPQEAKPPQLEQVRDLGRERPEAIAELGTERFERIEVAQARHAAVDVQLLIAIGDVLVGHERREVARHLRLGAAHDGRPLKLLHHLVDHPAIEVEADAGHEAVLLRSEQVARPANLEIPHRDLEPRAQLLVLRDRAEALVRLLG